MLVFVWGLPQMKALLDGDLRVAIPDRRPAQPGRCGAAGGRRSRTPEAAVYTLNWLSATGTGILSPRSSAGLVDGLLGRASWSRTYWRTLKLVRFSLLTIARDAGAGLHVTRYSGLDATLGLAFAQTGVLYPFFGTLLGWLGVALTGSDTSSNVLFGSLQKITAEQLGLSPTLMAAANSSGGVMGKMIDAQSIVVACTATRWYGHEGDILRYVFFHSLALAVPGRACW